VQVPGAFEVADCDLKDAPLFAHELGARTVAGAFAVISSGAAIGRLTPDQLPRPTPVRAESLVLGDARATAEYTRGPLYVALSTIPVLGRPLTSSLIDTAIYQNALQKSAH